jgi:polar amino acid transport system substrate-binding protein
MQRLKRRNTPLLIAFAAAFAIGVTAVGVAAAEAKSRLQTVIDRGKVIVAVTSEFPPLGFNDKNGNLVGFDIDFAKLLAKALFQDETKIKFLKIPFDARWPTVLTGKADVGVMGTTITADRIQRVAFTDVYVDSGISVLVRKDAGIETLEDLNNSKFTMARQGVLNEKQIREKYFPKAKEIIFSSMSDLFTAVRTKRADFCVAGTPVVAYYTTSNPDLKTLKELVSNPTHYGMFLAPGDFEWWLYLNSFVRQARSGTLYADYSKIYEKWFGTSPPPQNWYVKSAN